MNHDLEKKYLEYYAKELLETLYPDEYSKIEKDESPDLWIGKDYGIEVTWAMFENQGQARGILNHIEGKKIDQVDPRYVKTMKRIRTDIIIRDDGIVSGYMPMDAENKVQYREIQKAYEKKKAKKYRTNHTDLFIYPPLAQLDGWLGMEMIKECLDILSSDPANPFEHIIIYEEPTLYVNVNEYLRQVGTNT